MRINSLFTLAAGAAAYNVWLNEPDTGLETYLKGTSWTEGTLPPLDAIKSVNDFDFAARQVLSDKSYAFYRSGASGEWSYRNNLEVWSKCLLRPFKMRGPVRVNETMGVTILGYNFSAPFFISPAAYANYADPERGELNFVDAAAAENILYIPSHYTGKTLEEIGEQKKKHVDTLNGPQVTFHQIYSDLNESSTWDEIKRAEEYNAKAIVWTVDLPLNPVKHRGKRWESGEILSNSSRLDWDLYAEMKTHTKLPIVIKGITTVDDALTAVEHGVPAIILSNHGGRALEYSPSPLEIAYEIRRNAPEVFSKIEVLADSGIRGGTDAIKLLALGVKAVGLGKPFMYSNVYGVDGVRKLIQIMKNETIADAAVIGITDIHNIDTKMLNTKGLEQNVYLLDEHFI